MKKICLLLILSIVLTGCVYESFRSLYGDEWMADHLPNQESADQSNDTGHIGATPIINISDNSDDSNGITGDSSNDTIIPSVTTTTIRYTISFNANGGSGSMEDMVMQNEEEKALSRCSFTPPVGMKFNCWQASANNYASYYGDCEVVKDLLSVNGAVVTLSAQWAPHQYTVIYYGNGGIGQTARQTVSYGKSFALRENGFTRDGYTFIGWCTNSNGGDTGYNAGQTVSNLTAEDGGIVELYALWEEDTTDKWNINNAGNITLNGEEFPFTSFVQVISEPVTVVGSEPNCSYNIPVSYLPTEQLKGVFVAGTSTTINPYCVGRYTVTDKLYKTVMHIENESDTEISKIFPVIKVNWYDAITFCNKLSILVGKQTCYSVKGIADWLSINYSEIPHTGDESWDVNVNPNANGYRLPTEAEWEFAARGGDPTIEDWDYYYAGIKTKGDSLYLCNVKGSSGRSILDHLLYKVGRSAIESIEYTSIGGTNVDYYKCSKATSLESVGLRLPNRLGIYDMSGNVGEWCWDKYDDSNKRILRGGNYYGCPSTYSCSVYYHGYYYDCSRGEGCSFRLAYSKRE